MAAAVTVFCLSAWRTRRLRIVFLWQAPISLLLISFPNYFAQMFKVVVTFLTLEFLYCGISNMVWPLSYLISILTKYTYTEGVKYRKPQNKCNTNNFKDSDSTTSNYIFCNVIFCVKINLIAYWECKWYQFYIKVYRIISYIMIAIFPRTKEELVSNKLNEWGYVEDYVMRAQTWRVHVCEQKTIMIKLCVYWNLLVRCCKEKWK